MCGVAWLGSGNARDRSKHFLILTPYISPRAANDFLSIIIYYLLSYFFYYACVTLVVWFIYSFSRVSGTYGEKSIDLGGVGSVDLEVIRPAK